MIPTFDLIVNQGSTFFRTFNWYGGGKVMAPIEDLTPGYPTVLKVTAHGLPSISATPILISGVRGSAGSVNSETCNAAEATWLTDDTFSVAHSTVSKQWTPGTGEITWFLPSDLTGFTARMQIRPSLESEEVIHELTTENGGISLESLDGGVSLTIPADITELFDFATAVYDLELISPGLVVTPLVTGSVTLRKGVTR